MFKRALLTMAKKNYATLQELQEGNIVPVDEQLDLKGLAIDKSSMNMSTRKALKKILLEDILRADNIDRVQIIKDLAILEDNIYKSLASGSKDYYKPVTVKSFATYENPTRIQGIKASLAWNALRGDLEALDLVLQKPEVREAFLEQIDRLVRDKEELLQRQEAYKDLIKSTKDAFKFKTASFINTTVDSIVKEKLEDNIAYAVAEADLLEVVQGHINKD